MRTVSLPNISPALLLKLIFCLGLVSLSKWRHSSAEALAKPTRSEVRLTPLHISRRSHPVSFLQRLHTLISWSFNQENWSTEKHPFSSSLMWVRNVQMAQFFNIVYFFLRLVFLTDSKTHHDSETKFSYEKKCFSLAKFR